MLKFKELAFQELSNRDLYEILKLRAEVFIVEQNCPYLDTDEKDFDAIHLMGFIDEQLVAYARLLPKGISYEKHTSIGRVVTSQSVRKTGAGKELMAKALEVILKKWPKEDIKISAQSYLERFYESFGFVSTGITYLEDDIPHTAMIRSCEN
jgi:ElaA protein